MKPRLSSRGGIRYLGAVAGQVAHQPAVEELEVGALPSNIGPS